VSEGGAARMTRIFADEWTAVSFQRFVGLEPRPSALIRGYSYPALFGEAVTFFEKSSVPHPEFRPLFRADCNE
jgi:hypothetical protein